MKRKIKDCESCANKHILCFICLEFSEYETKIDYSKDLMNKPNSREMEAMK